MHYFFSTGEPSGELVAIALAREIRALDPEATFEGIGASRMAAAGFTIWRDNEGWATIGPLAVLPRIPKLMRAGWQTAAHIAKIQPDVLVLVDFGGFNVRLARELRNKFQYERPILDCFPPGAWLDSEKTARAVSSLVVPLTAFRRQYEFYKRLELPIAYFGHPLAASYTMRPARPAPPPAGGRVALLPGSRKGEIARLLPRLIDAFRLLRARRPGLRGVAGAADEASGLKIRAALRKADLDDITVVQGVAEATATADAAWVASGTAVLEATLSGVPVVALYALAPILIPYVKRVLRSRFITLPNLVLDEEVVPELMQHNATPERLADAMDATLRDPSVQYAAIERLHRELGPDDALESWAKLVVSLGVAGRAG